jgi:RsiW-degrading membrane proteinase PrsW (M82 family)
LWRLAVQEGGRVSELKVTFAAQTYCFAPGQIVRIGRSPDNAIVIPDPIVSREHARISWDAGGWTLDDLGKGRTFVGGLPVGSVGVSQPLDVHLASPLGPALRIELGEEQQGTLGLPAPAAVQDTALVHVPAADPMIGPVGAEPAPGLMAGAAAGPDVAEPVGWGELTGLTDDAGHAGLRHANAIHRSRLWRGETSASHSSPVYQHVPAHHARPDAPGGDFATAVHILVPVRSWLKDPGWKQGSRLLVIAYGLLPSLFVVLLYNTRNVSAPGWAYSLAIAPLWAVVFWLLIRPGHITKLIAWLAVAIVAAVMILLPVMTIPWELALDHTSDMNNPLPWIYGVGVAEEVTKALPVLIAALLLRWIWKITLDVRIWMFLGTIAGLAFGVRESVLYTASALLAGSDHTAGGIPLGTIPLILTFAMRVFVDGFQHAVWAGISAFFIGMGVNYRRRRIPLILFGITLPAVLHGLNDWSTQLASHWLWIAMEALSLLLFIGYTMSATTIERQVRDTPLFRGESMIMDRAEFVDDPAKK